MFKLLTVTAIIFSGIFVILLLVFQWFGQSLSPQLLAYVKVDQGIRLLDADRGISALFTPANKTYWGKSAHLHWLEKGQRLAFVYGDSRVNIHIYTVALADLRIKNLAYGILDISTPSWSPDSQYAAFETMVLQRDLELHIVDTKSGKILDTLTQPLEYYYSPNPAWSPNGQLVAFGAKNEMRILDMKSGEVISGLTQPIYEKYPRFWRWSPDNRWLVFASFHDKDVYHITLSVMDMNTGQVRHLFSPIDFSTSPPIWSPDSQYIAFSTINVKGETGVDEIHILNVITGQDTILMPENGNYFVQAWTPDGQQLVFFSDSVLYGINRNDNQSKMLVPLHYRPALPIQLSGDGQQLAFIGITGTLFVLDMDTGSIVPAADHVAYAAWQP